jgi:PAS domain S-box-containing protein
MIPRVTDPLWIITDAAGFIRECSPAALQLLGYSNRGAKGRELPNLFVADRPRLAEMLDAARGAIVSRKARLRPNDRRPVDVHFTIQRLASRTDEALIQWTFSVRWPINLRIPRGVDKRQLITMWRDGALRCVFVPAGSKRRLLVCARDEVVLEEAPENPAAALARADELRRLAAAGQLKG